MKRILTVAILSFVCCFAVSAQSGEQNCQKLELEAPTNIQRDGRFQVALNLEKSKQFKNAPIRWIIIKNSGITEITMENMVPVDAYNVEEGGTIIVLAETVGEKCRSFAMAKIFVEFGCALPVTFDEYGRLNWIDEKARLNNIAEEFKNLDENQNLNANKNAERFLLFAVLQFNRNAAKNVTKTRLTQIFNLLSQAHKIEKRKIVFLLAESDDENFKYIFLPESLVSSFANDNLVINGKDFERLENLFQSPIVKTAKK